MQLDNTIKDHEGNSTGIYESNIGYLADEYINALRDKGEIYNSNVFTGLIKYISRNAGFTRDILADINILNNIWDAYTDLVYRYSQKPTIEEYSILIGVSRDTVYSWLNGEYRSSDICDRIGTSRPDTVKKWQEECKLGRYKGAQAGNVGCIFLCKAVDGMAETAPIQVGQGKQALSASELPKLGGNNTQFIEQKAVNDG